MEPDFGRHRTGSFNGIDDRTSTVVKWDQDIIEFRHFLKLEKGLSPQSIEAYENDLKKLISYVDMLQLDISPEEIDSKLLQQFIHWIGDTGLNSRSQSRIISGIKAFFKYL